MSTTNNVEFQKRKYGECYCGSSFQFVGCCGKKPAIIQKERNNLIARSRREATQNLYKVRCAHPGCTTYGLSKCHSISHSSHLKDIAIKKKSEDRVYQLGFYDVNQNPVIRERPITQASVYPTFCAKHDKLFDILDNPSISSSTQEWELAANLTYYRMAASFMRDLHSEIDWISSKEVIDLHCRAVVGPMNKPMSIMDAYGNATLATQQYEKTIQDIKAYIYERKNKAKALEIAVGKVGLLIENKQTLPLTHILFPIIDTPKNPILFSGAYSKNDAIVSASTIKLSKNQTFLVVSLPNELIFEDAELSNLFALLFYGPPSIKKEILVIAWAAQNFDNLYINIPWFDSLPILAQQELLKMGSFGTEALSPRPGFMINHLSSQNINAGYTLGQPHIIPASFKNEIAEYIKGVATKIAREILRNK